MGAINYGTSDYITMGIKPYDVEDYLNDSDFMDYARETIGEDANEEQIKEFEYGEISFDYEADYANGEEIINRYKNDYFHVVLQWGYYEGMYVEIESNNDMAFNDWEEKRDAQKAITQIGHMLNELASVGFVACSPGWCTSYADHSQTQKRINDAIHEMRDEAQRTPTWLWYERNQHAKNW